MKHIKCKTKEQIGKVLKKLENDGYRWASGTMPTEFVPFDSYQENTVIEVDDKRRELSYASYGYFTENHIKVFIDSEDFVRDKKNKPSIVIFRRGRNVIAKDVATGDEGIAKCSPSDTFNFNTGASIALARLMAKTPDALNHDVKDEWIKVLGMTPVKKRVFTDADRNFKPGDRVVVRDWDDMAKEYGVTKWGDIPKDSQFTNSMKHLCGRTATVTCVEAGFSYKKVKVDFDDKSGSTACWTFNPWMFNPTDVQAHEKEKPEAKFKVGDYVTLKEGFVAGKEYGGLVLLEGDMYDNAHNRRMTVVDVKWIDGVDTYFYECKQKDGFTFHYSNEMLDKWDESKIHEGDTVRVVNSGLNYSSYVKWVEEHISDPSMAARFCFNTPDTCKKYKVIKIAEHEKNHRPLAFIEEIDGFGYNSCYLIEVKGLEKA